MARRRAALLLGLALMAGAAFGSLRLVASSERIPEGAYKGNGGGAPIFLSFHGDEDSLSGFVSSGGLAYEIIRGKRSDANLQITAKAEVLGTGDLLVIDAKRHSDGYVRGELAQGSNVQRLILVSTGDRRYRARVERARRTLAEAQQHLLRAQADLDTAQGLRDELTRRYEGDVQRRYERARERVETEHEERIADLQSRRDAVADQLENVDFTEDYDAAAAEQDRLWAQDDELAVQQDGLYRQQDAEFQRLDERRIAWLDEARERALAQSGLQSREEALTAAQPAVTTSEAILHEVEYLLDVR